MTHHYSLNCVPIQFIRMKKLFSTRVSENALAFALLLLRVGVGSLMLVQHGFDKLTHFAQKAPRFADPFHIGSTTSLSLVIFAEFFCAAFVIIGLFTRLACIPLVIAMSVALFSAHKGDFFGRGEAAGLFMIVFLALLFTGPGKISLDRLIAK
ncbi:MAG: DoxX family protein [Flavisolibacter sp.]|nr:DoxX family protein [Flavisolibacter sp.]